MVITSFNTNREENNAGEFDALSMSPQKNNIAGIFMKTLPLLCAVIFVVGATVIVLLYKPNQSTKQNTTSFNSNNSLLSPSADMPYLGNSNAKITVIAAFDPFCEYCQSFFRDVEAVLDKRYISAGLIKLYHWPFTLSEASKTGFEAMYCAHEQNRYAAFRKALLSVAPQQEGAWTDFIASDYSRIAAQVGLNQSIFDVCLSGGHNAERVIILNDERIRAGLDTTPSIVIENKIISHPNAEETSAALDRLVTPQ